LSNPYSENWISPGINNSGAPHETSQALPGFFLSKTNLPLQQAMTLSLLKIA
jgi:hypothetical protein